jgi:hypothetical protein
MDAAAGKTVLCLRHRYWDHPVDAHVDLAGYTKKLRDTFGRKGLVIETSAPSGEEARVLGEKLHQLLSK